MTINFVVIIIFFFFFFINHTIIQSFRDCIFHDPSFQAWRSSFKSRLFPTSLADVMCGVST